MTTYEPAPAPDGEALGALLDAWRAAYANGGVLVARLRAVEVPDPARWFRQSSVLHADTDVRELLASEAFRAALPELRVPDPYPLAAPPRFEPSWPGSLTLDGEWAAALVQGGAYLRFPGTAAEAKALAAAGVRELVGDRHEDVTVLRCGTAWSPWFRDVAWDQTWLLVDHPAAVVTVLCATHTD